jgi:16S rRNA (guanine966-N2)-methyltransferase
MSSREQQRKHPRSLRIIAGSWRGRRLTFPPSTSVRPTPDRVRETLFNWLRDRIEGARCLDLYAGSGVLGFEALSRGARETWFVERDRSLADAIAAHARVLAAAVRVVNEDVERFLERNDVGSFDIVFVDPPYTVPVEPIAARLPSILNTGALVYFERSAREGLPQGEMFRWHKTSRAGAVTYGLAAIAPAPRA